MLAVTIAAVVVAVLALAFAGRCYWELWKWARQCQHARIAIAYKRKVQLQAPLIEWLLWCNNLSNDKQSSGQVVWRNGAATVMITKAVIPPGKIRSAIKRARGRRATATSAPPVMEGTWSAKKDN